MKAVVVDTNVMIVANGDADQALQEHVEACVDALIKVQQEQTVVIDSGNRIFGEYFRHVSRSGRPGLGAAFAKWLHENQGYQKHCEKVDITAKDTDPDGWDFEEFPDDPDLSTFDRSDRKFVAVAIASNRRPDVLNATDTDWWIFRKPLKRHGVKIRFLCPDLMKSP